MNLGDWETSGVLDVSTLFDQDPGQLLLIDVQAHSLRGGTIDSEDLVQGGQLAFLVAPEEIADFARSSTEGTALQGNNLNQTLIGDDVK